MARWQSKELGQTFEDPPLAKFLFGDPRLALLWLPLRVWLGWSWVTAGWHKFEDPGWVSTGTALKTFWERAVVTEPKAPISFDWYRDFLGFMLNIEAYTWFAKLVTFTELTIGIALILGAFTGLAAFTGGFLNVNFLLAGTASTNGLLFVIATWLVLAWKTAGWIGLDRWLLPALGTPWQPGRGLGFLKREPKSLAYEIPKG